ncbi:MAG TPA: MBL fold metallo-hydrolase [Dehalococcoidia bacterium]|nr:MBL fold metallo-hydrolase [Dehalococcoidia bacterium]
MAGPRVNVGNVEIVALLDTPMEFDWAMFFPNNPRSDFDPYAGTYPESYAASGKFATNAQCYALRSRGKTVLVDTGLGPGPIAFLGGIRGNLVGDMRAKGVPPDSVDVVVFTHLHGDHVGWSLTADGAPTFPNARYYVPQGDWDFFSQALSANPQMGQILPLKDLGVLELFSGEIALTEEVTTYPTPGHTPGHTSLMVSSSGERALIAGDLAHHPAQVERSEWCSGFDGDPAKAIDSRGKAFDLVEADGLLTAMCHFPQPGFGKLVRLEGKRVFQAL